MFYKLLNLPANLLYSNTLPNLITYSYPPVLSDPTHLYRTLSSDVQLLFTFHSS